MEPTGHERRVRGIDACGDDGLGGRLADDIGDRLAVVGPERVEVHDTRTRRSGARSAITVITMPAVAVSDQDDVVEVFELDHGP